MVNFEKILERYSEIDTLLSSFSGTEFKIKTRGLGVEIEVPGINNNLQLTKKQLVSLENGDLIDDIYRLKYHGDCGLSYETYSEFFINITHPQYLYYEIPYKCLGETPLKFKIGKASIIIGSASPLIVLLMEPHYRDYDAHPDGF